MAIETIVRCGTRKMAMCARAGEAFGQTMLNGMIMGSGARKRVVDVLGTVITVSKTIDERRRHGPCPGLALDCI